MVVTSRVTWALATGAMTNINFFGGSFPVVTATKFLKLTLEVVDMLLEEHNVPLEFVYDFGDLLRELLVQPFFEFAVFSRVERAAVEPSAWVFTIL